MFKIMALSILLEFAILINLYDCKYELSGNRYILQYDLEMNFLFFFSIF